MSISLAPSMEGLSDDSVAKLQIFRRYINFGRSFTIETLKK